MDIIKPINPGDTMEIVQSKIAKFLQTQEGGYYSESDAVSISRLCKMNGHRFLMLEYSDFRYYFVTSELVDSIYNWTYPNRFDLFEYIICKLKKICCMDDNSYESVKYIDTMELRITNIEKQLQQILDNNKK